MYNLLQFAVSLPYLLLDGSILYPLNQRQSLEGANISSQSTPRISRTNLKKQSSTRKIPTVPNSY